MPGYYSIHPNFLPDLDQVLSPRKYLVPFLFLVGTQESLLSSPITLALKAAGVRVG